MKNHIIDLYYVTAKAFMTSHNYKDAKYYFEKSIEKYDNPLSHEEIGIIFFQENKQHGITAGKARNCPHS